jgi:hypothetical protein
MYKTIILLFLVLNTKADLYNFTNYFFSSIKKENNKLFEFLNYEGLHINNKEDSLFIKKINSNYPYSITAHEKCRDGSATIVFKTKNNISYKLILAKSKPNFYYIKNLNETNHYNNKNIIFTLKDTNETTQVFLNNRNTIELKKIFINSDSAIYNEYEALCSEAVQEYFKFNNCKLQENYNTSYYQKLKEAFKKYNKYRKSKKKESIKLRKEFKIKKLGKLEINKNYDLVKLGIDLTTKFIEVNALVERKTQNIDYLAYFIHKNSIGKYLSKKEIIGDIKILDSLLEFIYPIPTDRLDSEKLSNKVLQSVNSKQITNFQLGVELKNLLEPVIKDEHLNLSLHYNLFGSRLFPINLIKIGNNFLVDENKYNIPIGAKISKINNIDIEKISNKEFSIIDFSIRCIFKYRIQNEFNIVYEYKSDNYEVTLPAVSIDNINSKQTNKSDEYEKFSDYQYIKLSNFYDPKEFTNVINRINQCNNIIIDLRNNPGGYTMNALNLLNKLSNKELQLDFKNITNKHKWDLLEKYKTSTIGSGEYHNLVQIKANRRFSSQLILLVNNNSLSSSKIFAYLYSYLSLGKIIGTPPRSNLENIYAAKINTYELPNSEIEISVPLYQVKLNKEIHNHFKDRPLPIDIPISDSLRLEYFLQGKDAELEEALKLIREENKN